MIQNFMLLFFEMFPCLKGNPDKIIYINLHCCESILLFCHFIHGILELRKFLFDWLALSFNTCLISNYDVKLISFQAATYNLKVEKNENRKEVKQ